MRPSRMMASIAITSMIATSVIPAFGAEVNEVTDPLPNTGYSKVTVEVKDTSGGGGTDPDNPDPPNPPDPTEVIIATVPIELPIIVGLDGSITVPTDAKIINHSADKGIKVSNIQVDMDKAWTATDFDDDFTTKADNAKEIGLSFRGDTLSSDGTFSLTANNWDIGKQSELLLNMQAKLPKQTEISKTQAATVGFTIDWSGKDSGSEAEKVTIEFITDGNGEIEGNTQIVVESGATPTFPKVKPASIRYELSSWVDSSTNTEITTSTPITSDTVIKAVFSEKAASPKNWFTTDGANTITGLSAEYLDLVDAPTDLVIPNNIGGSTIKGIAKNAFVNKDLITSIVVPDTVTDIGYEAFKGCTQLKELNVDYSQPCRLKNSPYGLKASQIKWGASESWDTNPMSTLELREVKLAFNNGTIVKLNQLENNIKGSIKIPTSVDGVKVVGINSNTFQKSYITDITIPDTIQSIAASTFQDCTNLRSVRLPSELTSINGSTFSGCYGLGEVKIPDGVTSIGAGAFYDCSGLKELKIPDKVNSIGASAFDGCTRLENVNIPDGVAAINNYTFMDCTSLKSIDIPASVNSIGDKVFRNCTSLTSIKIPDGVTTIPTETFFGCTSLTKVELPDSVTKLDSRIFSGCTSLTSVNIPSGITRLDSETFTGCTALTSITIPDKVIAIGNSSFSGCTSLTSIDIPSGMKAIGSSVFSGCTSLENVKIPNSITLIFDNAFNGCTALKDVKIPNSVTSIYANAFYNVPHITYSGTASGSPWGAKAIN